MVKHVTVKRDGKASKFDYHNTDAIPYSKLKHEVRDCFESMQVRDFPGDDGHVTITMTESVTHHSGAFRSKTVVITLDADQRRRLVDMLDYGADQ